MSRSPPSISVTTNGSSHAKNATELPIATVQPAEPSARLISSMTSTTVTGITFEPAERARDADPKQSGLFRSGDELGGHRAQLLALGGAGRELGRDRTGGMDHGHRVPDLRYAQVT